MVSLIGLVGCQTTQTVLLEPLPRLPIADFDRGGWRTNLGDPFGGWDHDPEDPTQFCRPRLVDEPRMGGLGYSLKLSYDVESPNPAYNGFWMKLPSVPLRHFSVLSFAVKGDPDAGFTKRVKLELKGARNQSAVFILDGITAEWTRARVPLGAFRGIEKVQAAKEFVIVFDDETVTQPVGAIYLDEIAFESDS